jgi:hypothetical protein
MGARVVLVHETSVLHEVLGRRALIGCGAMSYRIKHSGLTDGKHRGSSWHVMRLCESGYYDLRYCGVYRFAVWLSGLWKNTASVIETGVQGRKSKAHVLACPIRARHQPL